MSLTRFGIPLAVASFAGATGAGAQRAPVMVERTGSLGRTPLTESSGVAASRAHDGVLWTHNDSDHGPVLYAIAATGQVLATFQVVGAQSVDWEDISLGPCPSVPWGGRRCLYIADTGDNQEERRNAVLYVVPEPDPRSATGRGDRTEPARALRVRFATGPHDVEALAIDPAGNGHLITKGRTGPILRYVVPHQGFLGDSIVVWPTDTLPIVPRPLLGRVVTGASISPDGTRAVVRTHTELLFFRPAEPHWVRVGEPCRLTGLEPQGEAVDYLDRRRLVLTSEKGLAAEGVIHVVACE